MIGNFRDIGGVKTKDGRTVKKGIFFRSSNLEDLTQEDISKIKDLGINHIFDYRTDEEATSKPVTIIPEIEYIRVPAFSMPAFNREGSTNKEDMMKEIFNMISTNKMYDMMLNLYSSLPIDNSSYKKLVDIIKNPNDVRFLSHCTSGKDRTGVGTAIIYMILGVDRETIIKDYLESNVYAKNQIEEMINKHPHLKEIPYEYINNMMGVNINYLMEVFKVIDSKYSSSEEYLLGEFGLTKDDINKIRDYCLE